MEIAWTWRVPQPANPMRPKPAKYPRATASLLLLTLSATASAQTTYYVDAVQGNDTNNGLAPASAWRTITRAANSGLLQDFDVVEVAPGR